MKPRLAVFHPILFAVFPILSLYIANVSQLRLLDALGSLGVTLLVTLLAWAGIARLLRDHQQAAILVSSGLLLFFSFAHRMLVVQIAGYTVGFYDAARWLVETQVGRLGWLAVDLLALLVLAHWLRNHTQRAATLTRFYNFFACVLLITAGATWVWPYFQGKTSAPVISRPSHDLVNLAPVEQPLAASSAGTPDIYYLILDGYGRSDILSVMYGIDDQPFLDFLRQRGFYIADDAHANYAQTALSLSSTLNFFYLDPVIQQLGQQGDHTNALLELMEDNRVFRSLRPLGYKVIIFTNGVTFTNLQAVDLTLGPQISVNSFQNAVINNTPLSIFLVRQQYDWHRQRILYTLERLPETTQIPGPKLVVAHILAPHPPFVLGPQGEPRYPARKFGIDDASDFMVFGSHQEYIQGYTDQLTFISQGIQTVVERILAQSSSPPIILIQGDHGPGSQMDYQDIYSTNVNERFSILSAYYFPGVPTATLYPGISPVNSFRVLFNAYFGAQYTLLEDRSYLAPIKQQFQLIDVTDQLAPPSSP